MIEFLIGVDGGGTGTRVRLARAGGAELAQGSGGPSGLGHGIANAWTNIEAAVAHAFAEAGVARPAPAALALGAGLAGVHNPEWAAQFAAANPGYAALRVASDAYTTLLGAHGGAPGCIVALGTGSVGEALLPDGAHREVGGWGFPSGDEASGAWLGLMAANHAQQVSDGRLPLSPFGAAVIAAMGGTRAAMQDWLARATQTVFATLAPLVLQHAASSPMARGFLADAGEQVARMADALDPDGALPLALCGGLAEPMRPFLPEALRARCLRPQGDAACGALRMIELHLSAAKE